MDAAAFHAELVKRYPQREPTASERTFFDRNREVAGYAAADKAVVLNPYSTNTVEEQQSVVRNERVRHHIIDMNIQPTFTVTSEQQKKAKGPYSKEIGLLRQTIMARIAAGDPSLGPYTDEQHSAVERMMQGGRP